MPSTSFFTTNFATLGVTYPSTDSAFVSIEANSSTSQLEGASDITFATAPSPAAGPVYFDSAGSASTSLTSTSDEGYGIASFPKTAASVTVTYGPSNLGCAPTTGFFGWPIAASNGVSGPLLPGFTTVIGESCQ